MIVFFVCMVDKNGQGYFLLSCFFFFECAEECCKLLETDLILAVLFVCN